MRAPEPFGPDEQVLDDHREIGADVESPPPAPDLESVEIEGSEIRFFGFQSDESFAPITREDFHLEGGELQTLWSPTVEGDTIGIEIALLSEKARAAFSFHVDEIAHTFRSIDPYRHAPKQLDCPDIHIDVQCRTGSIHDNLQDAVARIRFENGDSSYVCSGTLVNDTTALELLLRLVQGTKLRIPFRLQHVGDHSVLGMGLHEALSRQVCFLASALHQLPAAMVAATCRMPGQLSAISRSLTLPPITGRKSPGHWAGSNT